MSNTVLKTNIDNFEVHCFDKMESAVSTIMNHNLDNATIAVAINPEKILASRTSSETKNAIEVASFRYLDGMGAVWVASKKLGQKIVRIPGCELWEQLMLAAAKTDTPVFILGAKENVLLRTVDKLKQQGVEVVGFQDGYFSDEELLISEIQRSGAKILSVALGSPKQELFMKKAKDAGLTCFMMGVGGTYNVFVGEVKRAPGIWCKLNLEWLYRLISEPSRLFRQVKLIKYVYLALQKKL